MALIEYDPGAAFNGVIGRTYDASEPAWPRPLRAKAGAPNVLFVILDDTGFGQLGCFGSPIATPHLDSLAAADGSRHATPTPKRRWGPHAWTGRRMGNLSRS